MSDNQNPKPSPLKFILPILIFVVAFGFRLMGIGWGLPSEQRHQTLHPDEEVIWRYSQQVNPATGDFTPGFYNYGTLYLTVLRVASDMTAVYGGGIEKGAEWKYVGQCHRVGRVISALAGSATALLIFFMLIRRTNWIGAVVGSSLVAFSPALVVHSRFQTVDSLALFLLVAGLFFAHRASLNPEKTRDWLWAGLMVGLSAGTKYTGALGIIPVVAMMYWTDPRPALKWMAGTVGVMLAGFLVATPGALAESAIFQKDLAYEMQHTATGHGLVFEHTNGFVSHIGNLGEAIGTFALLASLACCFYMVKRKAWWPFLGFAVLHFLLIGRAEVAFMRYTLPLIPILGLALGLCAGEFHEKEAAWGKGAVALMMLSIGFTWRMAGSWTMWMVAPDLRDQLAQQADKNRSYGLVSDPWFWSPSFFPDSAVTRMPTGGLPGAIYGLQQMSQSTSPRVMRYVPENPDERYDWDVRLLKMNPDFIVYSNFEVGPVARLSKYNDLTGVTHLFVSRFKEFHKELEAEYEPGFPIEADLATTYRAAYYTVEDMAYVRPILYVWKKKLPLATQNP